MTRRIGRGLSTGTVRHCQIDKSFVLTGGTMGLEAHPRPQTPQPHESRAPGLNLVCPLAFLVFGVSVIPGGRRFVISRLVSVTHSVCRGRVGEGASRNIPRGSCRRREGYRCLRPIRLDEIQ